MDETSITFTGAFQDPQGRAIASAFRAALALDSKLPDWVLELEGMSGRHYRRFINTLVGKLPAPRYLEIGTWAGSTACSAIFGNRVTATCIDNWSEWGGPKDLFLKNIERASAPEIDFRFIESDFRQVDYHAIGTFDVYLFDGPHAHQDQYDALAIARPALAPTFVFIVDDWNWPEVRSGTRAAIADLGLESLSEIEIRTTQDDSHPLIARMQNSAWHNGYYIGVLKQRP